MNSVLTANTNNVTNTFTNNVKRYSLITLSALVIALNVRYFVKPAGLCPGGMSGLALLIQTVFQHFFNINIPYTLLSVCVNLFPVYIGFAFIGKRFTADSCLHILLTGIFVDILPSFTIVSDIMLLSVFGGFIHGFGIFLALSADATSGGLDFISIYFSEKKGKDCWNLILFINSCIIITSGFLFGWTPALYSVIFQFISTQVLHFLHKDYQKQTLLVITEKPKEICDILYSCTKHGATILNGTGGYAGNERTVVYSVISRAQVRTAIAAVKKCDPDAGLNSIKTEDFVGNFYMAPRY